MNYTFSIFAFVCEWFNYQSSLTNTENCVSESNEGVATWIPKKLTQCTSYTLAWTPLCVVAYIL